MVKQSENLEKSQKNATNHFFSKKNKIEEKKTAKKMLASYFSNIRRTRFDQSSPVQFVSESRAGSLSVREDGGGRRKSLCLI